MIKLSKRLMHLADMVSEGVTLADVGTDHGYIPIWLLLNGKIKRAFAMDIVEGPLQRAKEHTKAYGLGDYITLRLSDGVRALAPQEADSILIAGMGGGVMLRILKEGRRVVDSARELILQPQSEIEKVREYLYGNGCVIDREDIVFEDGKYYFMMHVALKEKKSADYQKEDLQMLYRYGKLLFSGRNDVLFEYLFHQKKQYELILGQLMQRQSAAAILRKAEIETELAYVNSALEYQKEGHRNEC